MFCEIYIKWTHQGQYAFLKAKYLVIQQDNASICVLRLRAAMAMTGKNAQQYVQLERRVA
jgi:hypothetical protein